MADIRIEQAARLAREWNSLGSIHFKVTEDLVLLPSWAGDQAFKSIESDYIETPAGNRYLDMVRRFQKTVPAKRSTAYADGQRFSILEYMKDDPATADTLYLGHSFDNEATAGGSSRPEPLRYYFIDKVPLHEALPNSTYLGATKHEGDAAHVFLFKDVFWAQTRQVVVLHLGEHAIFPHILMFYRSEEDRLADRPAWTWSATTVEMVQGKPIPTKSRTVAYDPKRSGREDSASEITVTKAEFGLSYPASTFWRDVDQKTRVFDSVKGSITPATVQPVIPKSVVNPIRVAPVQETAGFFGTASVIIGVVIIMASLWLWLRRR